ncbi:MAG: response regulator [Chloroflexi bacterium]|nr:response regulator [Chloroflexota bacterium]
MSDITMGNRKVMVVDDDAATRMGCRKLLVENGIDVAEAANGIEAISVYGDFRPDMVFMDIAMPGMDGLTALQNIIVMDAKAKIAMAIVKGQQALVLEALQTGAVDFVIKPFKQEQVLGIIKKVLK